MAASATVAIGGKRRRCTGEDDASLVAVDEDEKAPKAQKTSPEADLEDARRLIERLKGRLGDLHYSRDVINEFIRRSGFCQKCYIALARCSCQTPIQQAESVVRHLGGLADNAVRTGVVKLLAALRSQFNEDLLLVSNYADAVINQVPKSRLAAMVFYDLRYELNETAYDNALEPDSPMRWLVALLSSAGVTFGTTINDDEGDRALLPSACDGRPRLARLMLSVSSESVDVEDEDGNTPLALVIAQWPIDVDLVQELIRRSSDVTLNAMSEDYNPPLFELIRRLRDADVKCVHALLAAAHDDGSGVDLLSTRGSTGLLPDEYARRMRLNVVGAEDENRYDSVIHAVEAAKARVLSHRSNLVAVLYEALLRPTLASVAKEGYFKGITGLAQLVGTYIAPRFGELIAAQQEQRQQRPAAAAAAVAAAAAACQPP